MNNLKKKNLNFKSIVVFAVVLSFMSAGCSDRRYTSEKLFWKAQKKSAKILSKGKDKIEDSDYQKIIDIYRQVVDKCPLEPLGAEAQFIISNVYIGLKDLKAAKSELMTIRNNFASNPTIASRAHMMLAGIYEFEGEKLDALNEYEIVMQQYPLTPVGLSMPVYFVNYYNKNNQQAKSDDAYKKGIKHYRKLISDFAETDVAVVVMDKLAEFYLLKKDFPEAIAVWDDITKNYAERPQALKAYLLKAKLYAQELNDLAKAREVYWQIIKTYPKHPMVSEVKVQIGLLLIKDKKIEEAKALYQGLLKDYKDDQQISVKAYMGLSYCYREEADSSSVIKMYEEIKRRFPKTRAALSVPFLVAQYYEELKFPSKAESAYRSAIEEYSIAIDDKEADEVYRSEAANFLAICYIKNKDIKSALETLKILVKRYPQNPIYLLDMAMLYRNLNDKDSAVKVYEKVIKDFSENKKIVQIAETQIKVLTQAEPIKEN